MDQPNLNEINIIEIGLNRKELYFRDVPSVNKKLIKRQKISIMVKRQTLQIDIAPRMFRYIFYDEERGKYTN